jgi:hypothetical protein
LPSGVYTALVKEAETETVLRFVKH